MIENITANIVQSHIYLLMCLRFEDEVSQKTRLELWTLMERNRSGAIMMQGTG